ncbi:MAG TPA: universal stress protein [Chitinophagales bacterium]|nr:universal stress protein [Chitinophagales bacterium]
MKKILAVFDGLRYSASTIEYAADVAKATDSLLVGVFLRDLTYSRFMYTYSWEIPTQYALDYDRIEKEDEEKMRDIIALFEKTCEDKGVHFKIHGHTGVPLMELLEESAFADLLMIDTRTSFFNVGGQTPSTFLKDLLAESKCPVLIIPDHPEQVKHTVVAYDGSDSSVYAMKMFSYIFPEWKELDTTVVTVNHSASNHIPKNRDVKDLASGHFKNVSFKVLNGKPEKELEKYLKKNGKDAVVVMGSYGRSALSRMFHASISNKILKDVKVPLFITHQ